jgi:hypothetical protein
MSDEEVDFVSYEKDEPGESKDAAKATKKASTAKAAAKDAPAKAAEKAAAQAKIFQTALDEKATVDAADKEIPDFVSMMNPDQQAKMLAAMGVKFASVASASTPASKCRYDHEASLKRLMTDIAPVRAVMETHKDNYWDAYYMGSLSSHLMAMHNINDPANKTKKNEHAAFLKYFRKVQHNYGLGMYVPRSTPSSTPSIAGSKSVSRTASVAPVDNSFDESMEDYEQDLDNAPDAKDDAGAGAD